MDSITYLEPEEAAVVAALRLLATEQGRTRDGQPVAPTRAAYKRQIKAAQARIQAGKETTDRDHILAAAPLIWWIDMHSLGWADLIEIAGLAIAKPHGKPAGTPITRHGQSTTARDHVNPDDYHPPLPPMVLASTRTARTLATRSGERIPAPGPVSLAALPARITVHTRTTEIWSLR